MSLCERKVSLQKNYKDRTKSAELASKIYFFNINNIILIPSSYVNYQTHINRVIIRIKNLFNAIVKKITVLKFQ